MIRNYPVVARRAAHRCEYCRAPEVVFNFPFEVEHVLPLAALENPDDHDNLALACRACNLRKSDHLEGWDEATASLQRLFHPRSDAWEAHFQVDRATGRIEGMTPIGRATIGRLEMNSHTQRSARTFWISLGLFP